MKPTFRVLVVGCGNMGTSHWEDAVNSLRVVLAADESIKTGKTVTLQAMEK
jgi:hypothetical protein